MGTVYLLKTICWRTYLSNEVENHQADSRRRHTRTGRPLGTAEFVHNLEQVTGKPLAPKRAGRKPSKPKQVYCSRNCLNLSLPFFKQHPKARL